MDKKKLSVALLGSRGIPNRYGGFESFAEELSLRLVAMGHEITVYTAADHPVREENWQGVRRALVRNPEKQLGTFGQFFYDMNCNLHSHKQDFDIILHLGYTSDSVWFWLWKKRCVHIVNMDGQEWKRSKYSRAVRAFLRVAERMATWRSSWLVADSEEIGRYLKEKYRQPVRYIAYGAKIPAAFSQGHLHALELEPQGYDLVVARMEPENNIEMAIRAKVAEGGSVPLVIVGNMNRYKQGLMKKYAHLPSVRFLDAIYDQDKLNALRHFSRVYVHGHSVGGTNPSLLEAMACSCRIVAHGNVFNRSVLGKEAFFYLNGDELSAFLREFSPSSYEKLISNNFDKLNGEYNWEAVTEAYEKLFYDATGT